MSKIAPEKFCEVHTKKTRYGINYCFACFRANLNYTNVMKLKKLFPIIFGGDK